MINCLPCATNYHSECWQPTGDWNCCCLDKTPVVIEASEKKERGGQIKDMENVTDLESTGRKRAAKLYPLNRENPCEWRGLANAGGGAKPIVGCLAGMQVAIHHGPDKNTLSNFVGNVHRICATCHNRWHTENDPFYPAERPSGETPYLPLEGDAIAHDGNTKFTPEQFSKNELMWLNRKTKKANKNGSVSDRGSEVSEREDQAEEAQVDNGMFDLS